jgi:hypothetical protein
MASERPPATLAAAAVRRDASPRPLPERLAPAARRALAVGRAVLAGAFAGLAAGPAIAMAPMVPCELAMALIPEAAMGQEAIGSWPR